MHAEAAAASSNSTTQTIAGGQVLACATSGEGVLNYWGYTLSVGAVCGILLAFYAVFHIASYLALSRLYRQRR